LIYGINDIFDYETDKLNPKKISYEKLLEPRYHKNLIALIFLFNLPFLVYSFISLNISQIVYLLLFLFFAVFYSALPIRAKSKPFLDSFFSASHYVFTGIFGYYLIYPDKNFPILAFIFGMLWSMAMHAYSAVFDIEFDRMAKIDTIATFLGHKKTIIFCLILYTISFFIISTYNIYLIIGSIPYIALMILSIKSINDKERLFKIYKIFPYVNTILPMIWSILYIYQKFIF